MLWSFSMIPKELDPGPQARLLGLVRAEKSIDQIQDKIASYVLPQIKFAGVELIGDAVNIVGKSLGSGFATLNPRTIRFYCGEEFLRA